MFVSNYDADILNSIAESFLRRYAKGDDTLIGIVKNKYAIIIVSGRLYVLQEVNDECCLPEMQMLDEISDLLTDNQSSVDLEALFNNKDSSIKDLDTEYRYIEGSKYPFNNKELDLIGSAIKHFSSSVVEKVALKYISVMIHEKILTHITKFINIDHSEKPIQISKSKSLTEQLKLASIFIKEEAKNSSNDSYSDIDRFISVTNSEMFRHAFASMLQKFGY